MLEGASQLKTHSEIIPDLLAKIDSLPIDRDSIPQEALDLANKERSSLFPWRGQFSPQLIELLLSRYANSDSVILDPFVGSGTTLFEAVKLNLECWGVEINPAAFQMAKTAEFGNLKRTERAKYISRAKEILGQCLPGAYGLKSSASLHAISASQIGELIARSREDSLVHNLIVNAVMRHSLLSDKEAELSESLDAHCKLVEGLPIANKRCRVFLGDARKLPNEQESVDLVVTSPPYINVFNYHQNYRPVMELDGWDLLEVAKSEIGSNRRNRGNRFLTVVEYAIDMLSSLQELARVLKPEGRAIMVVGRQSSVRGIQFENYRIISCLAEGGAGLELVNRQERRFVNRFGERIIEDLLHFKRGALKVRNPEGFGRVVGRVFLEQALPMSPSDVVSGELGDAISRYQSVFPAPLFKGEMDGRNSEVKQA